MDPKSPAKRDIRSGRLGLQLYPYRTIDKYSEFRPNPDDDLHYFSDSRPWEDAVSATLRRQLLEALVSQLVRGERALLSSRSLARVKRAIDRRYNFEDIYLHEQMLADTVRMNAYQHAIERYVTAQDDVVDVGTGTGILAFMAAARKPRKIYALDHSMRMIDYARAVAETNGIDNVTFVASSSHEFRPEKPVDVMVQELMGIALFDEGMVETVLAARDRCLKPGGRILPAKFAFYLEPVQLIEEERIPLIQELQPRGLTLPSPPIAPEGTYYFREIFPRDVEFLLCEPEPVFTFDLTTLTQAELPKRFSSRKPVLRDAQCDGIAMYFRATFDDDISFSTGPDATRTHWPMLLYRTLARAYHRGEAFGMYIDVPEVSEHVDWSWQIDGGRDYPA